MYYFGCTILHHEVFLREHLVKMAVLRCALCPSAAVNAMERTELKISLIAEQLGLSWAGVCVCVQSH